MVCEKALESLASWLQESAAAATRATAQTYDPSIRD
jgi:hypothetical protein